MKIDVKTRREMITKKISEVGIWNINQSELARQFSVSQPQINHDLKIILEKIPPDDIKAIKQQLSFYIKKACREADKLLDSSDPITKARGIKELRCAVGDFTQFLESWGDKGKMADKLEITGDINSYSKEHIIAAYSSLTTQYNELLDAFNGLRDDAKKILELINERKTDYAVKVNKIILSLKFDLIQTMASSLFRGFLEAIDRLIEDKKITEKQGLKYVEEFMDVYGELTEFIESDKFKKTISEPILHDEITEEDIKNYIDGDKKTEEAPKPVEKKEEKPEEKPVIKEEISNTNEEEIITFSEKTESTGEPITVLDNGETPHVEVRKKKKNPLDLTFEEIEKMDEVRY